MKRFLYIVSMFMLCLFIFSPHSYASSSHPPVDGLVGDMAYFIILDPDGRYVFYKFDFSAESTYEATEGIIFRFNNLGEAKDSSIYVARADGIPTSERIRTWWYHWDTDREQWVFGNGNSNITSADYLATSRVSTFITSNVNVYDYSTGDLVFHLPPEMTLPEVIQAVTTEEIQKQSPTLVGTMKILTVCGVGLMSLLIGLALFGKLFRTFLAR